MNYDQLTGRTIQHLQALIRLDTSNPPGNESLAVRYIAGVLDEAGIPYVTPERRPGRANLIARLKGDGSAAPLLLMGHTDVVPVEPDKWTHPPFSGVIADGHLWGRGALDMKFMDAYELATFITLHALGAPLRRDVILALTADEEIADGNGIDWIAAEHPDLIRAEFALNELGATTTWLNHKPIYPIQVAEKGVAWLRLTADGVPGHASIPMPGNPIGVIGVQVGRLYGHVPPLHLTETMRAYLAGAARVLETDLETLLDIAHNPMVPNPIADRLPETERATLFAQLHNTAVPTGLSGGYKTNVIPSTATAIIDGRALPGFTTVAFLDELRTILDPAIRIEVTNEAPPLEVPYQNALYRLMQTTLEALHPGAEVLPTMMVGATDAKFLAPLGVKVYGFSPIRFEPGAPGQELIHSHDERIPVDGLAFGVEAIFRVIERY